MVEGANLGQWRWREATYFAALLVSWTGVIWGFVGGNSILWPDILFAGGSCVALLVAPVPATKLVHRRLRLFGVGLLLAFLTFRVWLLLSRK